MPEPVTSLRERSKAKRRASVQRAAMRLFAERGYDNTTIAEIADEAELAPRTVSMYFPTKLHIALAASDDIAARLTAIFQQHPHLSFTEIVDRWLVGEAAVSDPEFTALMIAMFDANPDLRAVSTTHITEAASFGRPAFLAETGLSEDDPMLKVAAATVSAVIGEYLMILAAPTGAGPGIHDAFMRYLRAVVTAGRPT